MLIKILGIKSGLNVFDAEFIVQERDGVLICNEMLIEGVVQNEHTTFNYFKTHYDEIEKIYYR